MITAKNGSKTLAKHMSCECKCKFDGRKYSQNQKWNSYCFSASVKDIIYVKKIVWNCATCICKNGKYLASIIDDPFGTCDEIIEEIKSIPTNFNDKRWPVKHKISRFNTCLFMNYHCNINSC